MLVLLDNNYILVPFLFFFSGYFLLQAQTEVFIRACSAVESKLEHVVEELKKDRFLGDSDWPVVWR